MVLQNKYKARASAKHNRGRGGGGGRGRGRGRGGRVMFPDGGHDMTEGQYDGDSNEEEDEEGDEESEENDEENAAFPSLKRGPAQSQKAKTGEEEEEDAETTKERGKYSRRKIESNAWRFEQMRKDQERDPDVEPEPEVDLTALLERVKLLDSSKELKAGVTLGGAGKEEEEEEERKRIEADIDHSLAYLSEKDRARQARRGRLQDDDLPQKTGGVKKLELTEEEREHEAAEREEMLKEKEKSEALRALKERFQGRAVGERETKGRTARLNAGDTGTLGSTFKLPSSGRREPPSAGAKSAALPARDEQGDKPKTQVESMQDFLDGMLG